MENQKQIYLTPDRLCRTCMYSGTDVISLFDVIDIGDKQETLSSILVKCTSIQVTRNDIFPQQICQICLRKLLEAFLFREDCHRTHVKFEELFNSQTTIYCDNVLDIASHDTGNVGLAKKDYIPKHDLTSDAIDKNIHSIEKCDSKLLPEKSNDNSDYDSCIETDHNVTEETELVESDFKYVCSKCNKTFWTESSRKAHENSHVKRKLRECDVCGKQFTRYLLQAFIDFNISNRESLRIYIFFSDTMFLKAADVKRHMSVHTGLKPYSCAICHTSFTQSGSLATHMKKHDNIRGIDISKKTIEQSPYLCPYCGKAFKHSSSLTTHVRSHNEDKPYFCMECDMRFVSNGKLTTHMRIHTGERPYICKYCGSSFSQSTTLKKHIRSHLGTKDYKCQQCNKTFATSYYLNIHKRKHTGEQPLKCNICARAFSDPKNLKQHKMIHSGDRPYHCLTCGKAFRRSHHLKAHMGCHIKQIFWITFNVCMISATALFLVHMWSDYLDTPTIVSYSGSNVPIQNVYFPGVAICNINKISKKKAMEYAEEINSYRKLGDIDSILQDILSPSCEDMLQSCRWAGKSGDCTKLFTRRITYDGFCCTFNYVRPFTNSKIYTDTGKKLQVEVKEPKKPIGAGAINGLSIALKNDLEDYFFTSLETTGYKVLIFNTADYPDKISGSFTEIIAGFNKEVLIGLRVDVCRGSSALRQLPLSLRSCMFSSDSRTSFGLYSHSDCLVDCKAQRKWSKYHPKDMKNEELMIQEKHDSMHCSHCLPSCSHTVYKPYTSIANVLDNQNITHVHIYFDENFSNIYKIILFQTWFEILSNFGGILSLLLGVSVISAIEIEKPSKSGYVCRLQLLTYVAFDSFYHFASCIYPTNIRSMNLIMHQRIVDCVSNYRSVSILLQRLVLTIKGYMSGSNLEDSARVAIILARHESRSSDQTAYNTSDDVSVQVGCEDDVEMVRLGDELHATIVHDQVIDLNLRILFRYV
nr:unnamed protein product [Callosobruchus analis]